MDRRRVRARPGAPLHPATWLADPLGRHEIRYWDGWEWTAHVSDGGIPATDPPATAGGPVDLPVPRRIAPAPADVLIPRPGARTGAPGGPRRRLWPWLVAASTAILLGVIVTGTGATPDPARPATRIVRRSSPVASRAPTPTTTLPVPACQRIVLEVQAGIRPMTEAGYRSVCGPLPSGVVLAPPTTTGGGASGAARRP